MVSARAGDRRNGKLLFDGFRVSVWEEENFLEMMVVHQMLKYVMPLNCT